MWFGTFTHTCTAPWGMVVGTCHLQGRQPLPWGRSPVSFEQIGQTFIFLPVAPDDDLAHLLWAALLQWGFRYGPSVFRGCCSHHGQFPCEFWADQPNFIFQLAAPDVIWHIYSGQCCFTGDGDIHLPSSGEVLLGLGKVPCESGKDHIKHCGNYPWDVCQGPRPLKSESGRMEQWNVVSSYVTWTLYLVVPHRKTAP